MTKPGEGLQFKIEGSQRLALSEMLKEARNGKGWNQERAAEEAQTSLRLAAEDPATVATPKERRFWVEIEISRHHVQKLENFPAAPLATPIRRACLLGLVLALGLDRVTVSRLAGGL